MAETQAGDLVEKVWGGERVFQRSDEMGDGEGVKAHVERRWKH